MEDYGDYQSVYEHHKQIQYQIKKFTQRFERVKHIMSEIDINVSEGIDWELKYRPCGEWLTAKNKILRKYEKILGISAKGNKSILK